MAFPLGPAAQAGSSPRRSRLGRALVLAVELPLVLAAPRAQLVPRALALVVELPLAAAWRRQASALAAPRHASMQASALRPQVPTRLVQLLALPLLRLAGGAALPWAALPHSIQRLLLLLPLP